MMDFAKSLFHANSNDRKGYVGRNTVHKLALVESACDDPDQEVLVCSTDKSGLCQVVSPKAGVPFSAVTPSMWPPDVPADDSGFDELGFRIEEEDGPEQSSNKLLGIPFTEDHTVRTGYFTTWNDSDAQTTADMQAQALKQINKDVQLSVNMQDSISAIKYIPGTDDTHLAISSWDGFVTVVHVDSNWPKSRTQNEKGPILDCFATDINNVFYGGLDNKLFLSNFSSDGSDCKEKEIGVHDDAVSCVDYSPERALIITGSWDCSVKLWDPRNHRNVAKLNQVEQVFCMKVRGDLLVVATGEKKVLAWDIRKTSTPLINRPTGTPNYQSRCIDIFPDKNKYVIGTVDGRISIEYIQKASQSESYAFKGHVSKDVAHPVNAIRVMDETPFMVSGGSDGRVRVWDVKARKNTTSWEYADEIAALEYSPLNDVFVIGSSYLHDRETDPSPMPPSRIIIRSANRDTLQWLAYLEFSHSREEVHELSWDSIPLRIPITQKLWEMMTNSKGIPHSLRPQMWLRLSGALEKRASASNQPYWKIVRESTANEYFSYAKHIEKDLTRILPGNGCFTKSDSPGIPRLRRLLRSIAWLYPEIGYCQGFGTVVAHLLLFMEEEDVFWLMVTIIEDILPGSYFSSDFIGIRTDSLVLSRYVAQYFPNVDQLLKEHDIELGLIVFTWFLTLFASVVHVKILLRVWDLFFAEGDLLLFKVMLALIKLKVDDLLQLKNSAEIFNFLSDLPSVVEDFDILDVNQFESLNRNNLEQERRKQSSALATDGSIFTNNSRRVKKRDFRKPEKSGRGNVLKTIFGEYRGPEDMKNKNVRQTELMVDLHEAILQIGRHFIASDQKFTKISLEPDFSIESHAKDHEKYTQGYTSGTKRAKALADFERRDDDELGFRKNDILTIMSSKDEHCWIGELNGLRGWFPAKCVVILDERSKQYSAAGDDSVTEGIADLVRGTLCPAMKRIFEQGMKKPTSLVGPIHPWMFIEEVAMKEIERDYKSVYSRLVLCKTYRLDEDGKVLSPEELLYRCVELVNRSHEKVQMDIKMRSLICLGLNEQVLHLWTEILCSSTEVVNKWYHPWSFLNSPGWVGLKCELRILSQFSFTLNPDWELRSTKEDKFEVKNGVRDMLVKHHLFSWNL